MEKETTMEKCICICSVYSALEDALEHANDNSKPEWLEWIRLESGTPGKPDHQFFIYDLLPVRRLHNAEKYGRFMAEILLIVDKQHRKYRIKKIDDSIYHQFLHDVLCIFRNSLYISFNFISMRISSILLFYFIFYFYLYF